MTDCLPKVTELALRELMESMEDQHQYEGVKVWQHFKQLEKEDPKLAEFIREWVKNLSIADPKTMLLALSGPVMVYKLLGAQIAVEAANSKFNYETQEALSD